MDEIHEVIPFTEDCGVWHPQEGVFNGHFQPKESQKINRIGQLRQGVLKAMEYTSFEDMEETVLCELFGLNSLTIDWYEKEKKR